MKKINALNILTLTSVLVSVAALLQSGCTSSKNSTQIADQLLAEKNAQFQSAAGNYSGKLVTKSGQVIGAVVMRLDATLATATSSSTSTPSSPSMTVTLDAKTIFENLQTSSDSVLTFQNNASTGSTCQFLPDQNSLSGTNNINIGGGSSQSTGGSAFGSETTANMTLNGILHGDHFSGTLYALGHEDMTLSLELDRNGASLEQIASTLSVQPNPNPLIQMYTGTLFFPTNDVTGCKAKTITTAAGNVYGQQCTVNLTVQRSDNSPDTNFVSLLFPRAVVDLNFDFGAGAQLVLPHSAVFAADLGSLIAPAVTPANNAAIGNVSVNCTIADDQGLDCTLTDAKSDQLLGTFTPVSTFPPLAGIGQADYSVAFKGQVVRSDSTKIAVVFKMTFNDDYGSATLTNLMSPSLKSISVATLDFTEGSGGSGNIYSAPLGGCNGAPGALYNEQNHSFSACGQAVTGGFTMTCTDVFFGDAQSTKGQPYNFDCSLTTRTSEKLHFQGTY